jgi:hypothetical protein
MIAVSLLDATALTTLVTLTDRWSSATGVAVFAALRTACNAVYQATLVILVPISPELSRYACNRDSVRSSALLGVAWILSTGPIAFATTAGLPLVEEVFFHWTLHSLPFSSPLFISMAGAVLVRQWTSPLVTLLYCTNCIRAQFWIALVRCGTSIGVACALFSSLDLAAMGLAVLLGEVTVAATVIYMTSVLFPGLCDVRCRITGGLASVAVGLAFAALVGWWWFPAVRWPLWIISLVLQTATMTAQWRYLHSTARGRILAFLSPFIRRVLSPHWC